MRYHLSCYDTHPQALRHIYMQLTLIDRQLGFRSLNILDQDLNQEPCVTTVPPSSLSYQFA